jgi:hypothetical protein
MAHILQHLKTDQIFRSNYTGEVIYDARSGTQTAVQVAPRQFQSSDCESAIVLGNGPSRLNNQIQVMLRANSNRPYPAYKSVYACNATIRDTKADYYVVKNGLLFQEINSEKYPQLFLQSDLYLLYRDANLIPLQYHYNAGVSAAHMAAFDEHKKVFLFGFDGQDTVAHNIYTGTNAYSETDETVSMDKWEQQMLEVIRTYPITDFYRVMAEGCVQSPDIWLAEPNFHQVSIREAVLAGDF